MDGGDVVLVGRFGRIWPVKLRLSDCYGRKKQEPVEEKEIADVQFNLGRSLVKFGPMGRLVVRLRCRCRTTSPHVGDDLTSRTGTTMEADLGKFHQHQKQQCWTTKNTRFMCITGLNGQHQSCSSNIALKY